MVILSAILVVSMSSSALVSHAQQSISSETLQLGVWQLRESKWYSDSIPDFTFCTPMPSVLRIASSASSAGAGYVFVQLNRTDLDGNKLQVRWNEYYTYPDQRDLNILEWYVFDQAFDRREMGSYFADDVILHPPNWNITCAYVEGLHYPGPLGAPAGWLGWRTDTSEPLNLSSWTSDTVTVLFRNNDAWWAQVTKGDFDWFKILDADNNEVYAYEFDGTPLMEVTGTFHDYGLIVSSGEPVPTISTELSSNNIIVTEPGFCFTADVELAEVTNLYGYALRFNFDPAMLTMSGVELSLPAEWDQDHFIVRNETIVLPGMGTYVLAVTALYPAPAFNGSMTVAALNFSVTNSQFVHMRGGTVETFLSFRHTMLVDNLGTPIPHMAYAARVTMSFPLISDINGDGIVDMIDVVKVAIAYRSQPGDPNWNTASDLNKDGIVNVIDLVIVGADYGRTTN